MPNSYNVCGVNIIYCLTSLIGFFRLLPYFFGLERTEPSSTLIGVMNNILSLYGLEVIMLSLPGD